MKRVLVVVIKIVSVIIITIIGIVAILLTTLYLLNENHKLTEPAKIFLNHYIVGEMEFDNLYLDIRDFPNVNLTAENGLLISHLYKYPTDTLATFDKLDVIIEIDKLWADSLTISVPSVKVTNGFTLVTISENRVPGWNVWRFRSPRPRPKVKQIPPQRLWIDQVQLSGHNKFLYYNHHRKRIMHIEADSVYALGSVQIRANNIYFDSINVQNLTADISLLGGESIIKGKTARLTLSSKIEDSLRYYTIDTQASDMFLQLNDFPIFTNSDSVSITGALGLNPFSKSYASKSTLITINENVQIDLNGKYNSGSNDIELDLAIYTPSIMDIAKDFKLDTLSIFKQITPYNMGVKAQVQTKGTVNLLDMAATLPPIALDLKLNGGSLGIDKIGVLNQFNSDISAIVDINNQSADRLDIKALGFKYKESSLKADGTIYMNNIDKPIADVNIVTTLNIEDLKDYIPDSLQFGGEAYINASIVYPLYKGADKSLMSIAFNDSVKFSNLTFIIPHTNAKLISNEGVAFFDYNDKLLKYPDMVKLQLDSISLNSYHDMDISADGLDMNIDIIPSTTRFIPDGLKGGLSLSNGECDFFSLDTISINQLDIDFDIDLDSIQAPIVNYIAILDNIQYNSNDSILILLETLDIEGNATLYQTVDLSKNIKYKLWDIIGNWKYQGNLMLDSLRGIMPQLPLISVVSRGDLDFSQDNLNLNQLDVSIGDSYGSLSGTVDNWRNYIINDSLLTIRANLTTEHVMLNELIPAIVDGGIYSQSISKDRESTINNFLGIPSNLDVELNTSIRNTNYNNIIADSACFNVDIKNQGFYMDSLRLSTNFLRMGLFFSYITTDRDSADATLHFDIEEFNATKLIGEM
ncbi:MAG: hypothetical protein R3Y22_03905, partial [Bacteroidales bacterium]